MKKVHLPCLILTFLMSLFVNFYVYGQQEIIYCDFNGNQIRRTIVGTSIDEPFMNTGMQPRDLILDQGNNSLYWLENETEVFTMSVDGSGKQEVPINASEGIGNLALDEENQILYFNEFFAGNINAYNIESKELITIITNVPQGLIAFSKLENALYYSNGATSKIMRYDLATEQSTEIIGGFSLVTDMAIDLINSHIYISEFNSRKVYRCNLDGTELQELQEGLGVNGRLYLIPENDTYFWSDNLAPGFIPTIYESNMSSNETEMVFEYGPNTIGGFVVLGETTSHLKERKNLKPSYFPNPASDRLIIEMEKMMNVESIGIYTLGGQLVNTQTINNVSKRLGVSLDDVNSGMYILKVDGDEVVEPILFHVFR